MRCHSLIRSAVQTTALGARGRQLGSGGGVGGDVAGPDGCVQRRPERCLHADQGRGGHRPAYGLVLAADRGEHRLHVRWRQVG